MPEIKCGFDDAPGMKGSDALVLRGPTLIVQIGFDPFYRSGAAVPIRPNLPVNVYEALVDTGALESCIDSGLAIQLNLPVINRQRIAGISGAREVNMHLAQIHIPLLAFTIYGAFAAVDLIAGDQAHHALIGRTFLRDFRMVYEGDTGTVTLSTPPVPGA
jgi:predicted aspartyl protease